MKHRLLLPFLIFFLAFTFKGISQITKYTVQVDAVAQTSPPQIQFTWPVDTGAVTYEVYRKLTSTTAWGFPVASFNGTATTWTDTSISVGQHFDYYFKKFGTGYTGYGYIVSGVERPEVEQRGRMLLVVDSTYKDSLVNELAQLTNDLEGDGWRVTRIDVDRTNTPPMVKALIVSEYTADPTNVKAVYLFGHVPVPYSGNINPDGHPDHQGAWPADVYYADMGSSWSDLTINNVVASRPENQNVPGDGKFDQSSIPSDAELMLGRVDFANMPSFAEGELAMLRRYIAKSHAWKFKMFTADTRAVIDDNFGVFTGPPLENFATSGWRNFSPLIGTANVFAGDYRTEMLTPQTCLWSYGCGGGWYQGASGVTTTGDFVNDSLTGVFSMIFGSYNGDWDASDNVLRASLASKGNILTMSWAGRPQWHTHHMGLGEPIGFSTRITQNNNASQYVTGIFPRYVHIALMGDPSLRMHVVGPASNLVITPVNGGRDNDLSWTASTDAIVGYIIYREDSGGTFIRLNANPSTATTYTDPCVSGGTHRYMVRALKLETVAAGTYYNLSQGIIGSVMNPGTFNITTSTPLVTFFCEGETFNLTYTLAANDFCPGNQFNAELSDASGSFLSPVMIGTATNTTSGSIVCTIPLGTPAGLGYRLRVKGTMPTVTGPDNGNDLEIKVLPVAAFISLPNGLDISFTNTSTNATSYNWNFGDGNTDITATPTHTYSSNGNYTITLIVTNDCGSDTTTETINIVAIENGIFVNTKIFPNPFEDKITIETGIESGTIELCDVVGKVLRKESFRGNTNNFTWNLKDIPKGIYFIKISDGVNVLSRKIAKN